MSLQLKQQYFIDRSAEAVFHAYNTECKNEYSLIESFKNEDGLITDENFSKLTESEDHLIYQQRNVAVLPVSSRHDQVMYIPAFHMAKILNCSAIEYEIYEGYYMHLNFYEEGRDVLSISVNWDTADYQITVESSEFIEVESEMRKFVDILQHSEDEVEIDQALDDLHNLIDDADFLFDKFNVKLMDLINPQKKFLQTAVTFN